MGLKVRDVYRNEFVIEFKRPFWFKSHDFQYLMRIRQFKDYFGEDIRRFEWIRLWFNLLAKAWCRTPIIDRFGLGIDPKYPRYSKVTHNYLHFDDIRSGFFNWNLSKYEIQAISRYRFKINPPIDDDELHEQFVLLLEEQYGRKVLSDQTNFILVRNSEIKTKVNAKIRINKNKSKKKRKWKMMMKAEKAIQMVEQDMQIYLGDWQKEVIKILLGDQPGQLLVLPPRSYGQELVKKLVAQFMRPSAQK